MAAQTRFGIIGAAGYIAPRHLKAIRDVGGKIIAACDVHDAVGVLDSYARDCRFTCDPEEFFHAFLYDVDTIAVCTPNFLHCSHTYEALAADCNVVLEKPIAIRGKGYNSADTLIATARDFRRQIYPVVQLRYHKDIQELRETVRKSLPTIHNCNIDYATYRGPWYDISWKGQEEKSGGLLTNLGVHLFDLCLYVFGPLVRVLEATVSAREASGKFECARALITWRLSSNDKTSKRVFCVDGNSIDLSNRMKILHERVYREAVQGHGFALEDVAQSLYLIDEVKKAAQ